MVGCKTNSTVTQLWNTFTNKDEGKSDHAKEINFYILQAVLSISYTAAGYLECVTEL
jgi:hypothetical protein